MRSTTETRLKEYSEVYNNDKGALEDLQQEKQKIKENIRLIIENSENQEIK